MHCSELLRRLVVLKDAKKDLTEDQKANFLKVLDILSKMLNRVVSVSEDQIWVAFQMIMDMIGERESGGDWKKELLPIVTWLQTCRYEPKKESGATE